MHEFCCVRFFKDTWLDSDFIPRKSKSQSLGNQTLNSESASKNCLHTKFECLHACVSAYFPKNIFVRFNGKTYSKMDESFLEK